MREMIVTDLTRFAEGKPIVCVAAIDIETGECFRPMPYFSSDKCKELNIHPGAILQGKMTLKQDRVQPHLEDASYNKLTYLGPCSGESFQKILDSSLSQSISDGFGIIFEEKQKYIPLGVDLNRSIITIKIKPNQINIHEDKFKPGKIKATIYSQRT